MHPTQNTSNLIAPMLPQDEGLYPVLEISDRSQLLPPTSDSASIPLMSVSLTLIILTIYFFGHNLSHVINYFKAPNNEREFESAFKKLDQLNYLESKNHREYSIMVVDIFREHLSLQNKTYEEAIEEINKLSIPEEMKFKTKGVLAGIERVKFAREYPSFGECQHILKEVKAVLQSFDDQKKRLNS